MLSPLGRAVTDERRLGSVMTGRNQSQPLTGIAGWVMMGAAAGQSVKMVATAERQGNQMAPPKVQGRTWADSAAAHSEVKTWVPRDPAACFE
jgi:hypothetical protein